MSNDFKQNTYFAEEANDRVPSAFVPSLDESETVLEMGEDFNIDGFQVVRREFFAHLREPSITFNDRKVYVNSACLAKFPHVEFVQALINPDTKIFCISINLFSMKMFKCVSQTIIYFIAVIIIMV